MCGVSRAPRRVCRSLWQTQHTRAERTKLPGWPRGDDQSPMPNLTLTDGEVACARRTSRSQFGEDLVLLPTLLAAALLRMSRRQGIFVELGAMDGETFSNTLMLEQCFGWVITRRSNERQLITMHASLIDLICNLRACLYRSLFLERVYIFPSIYSSSVETGLLIEANPKNFERLKRRRPRAALAHSAVCSNAKSVAISKFGGTVSGEVAALPTQHLQRWGSELHLRTDSTSGLWSVPTVQVPCTTMGELLAKAQLPHATFLSLDVEGAEERVVNAMKPSQFDIIMVESRPGWDTGSSQRIHRRLLDSGFRLATSLHVQLSRIYLRRGLPELTPLVADSDSRFLAVGTNASAAWISRTNRNFHGSAHAHNRRKRLLPVRAL